MKEFSVFRSTKLRVFSLILLLFIVFFSYKYARDRQNLQDSLRAPSFALLNDKNEKVSFPDALFTGVTLIHFWASWCEPCLDELPELFEFVEGFSKDELRLLAVSLDQSWSEANTILEQQTVHSENIIQLIDPELKVAHLFGSFQYPETIVIQGVDSILTKWVGPQKWDDDYYKKLLMYFIENKNNDKK